MNLWSTAFLEQEPNSGGSATVCWVSHANWRRLDIEHQDAQRIFCEIGHEGKKVYCPLGPPLISCDDADALYVPYSVIEKLGTYGSGEPVAVRWLTQEAFPEATRIILRPHDSAFYHVDAKEELERELTQIGVIQEGETVIIRLEALGGFELAVDIIKTEPANVVLAQGDEVAIEFEEALDARGAQEGGTAAPVPAAVAEPFSSASEEEMIPMIPHLAAAVPTGQRLGGSAPRLTADGKRWNPWR